MENAKDALARIETTLENDIPAAALKRDLNKMVLALVETVKDLVVVAKEVAETLDGGVAATEPPKAKKAPKKLVKKAAAKADAPKRTLKTPIQPK